MTDLAEIGRNIALLRKARGLSREQAALESNMSVSRWQDIEHGCKNTTVQTLRGIAETLGVSPLTLGILQYSDDKILSMTCPFPLPLKRLPGTDHIGYCIVLLRKRMGFSQRRLALAANVSTARLRDIEHGCANVTIEVLDRIANAFGLSLFALGTLPLPDAEVLDMVRKARAVAERIVV